MSVKAFICGCAGPRLSDDEKAFVAGEQPFGLILFQRNCREPSELRDLTAAFRDAVGRADAPVLIDQEGGRVQRLKPPHWPSYVAAEIIGRADAVDPEAGTRLAWLHGRLMAADLLELGIDVDCAPTLDVMVAGMTKAIGDRSFGGDPQCVTRLGRALANGLLDGGVLPVIKHLPGHGRATTDSHLDLPVVEADLDTLAASDFVPFAALADLPGAMTAHIVYTAIDPERPATLSPTVIRDIIRGRIGFEGLLFSDDVSMSALSGDYGHRTRAIHDAGCDLVLHCNGRTEEMRAVADAAPELSGFSGERAARFLQERREPEPFERERAREEYCARLADLTGATVS